MHTIIDNFLPEDKFNFLKQKILFSKDVGFYLNDTVAFSENLKLSENESQNWNWYATHIVYNHIPNSSFFPVVDEIFRDSFENFKMWIRIKCNFYPYTQKIKEHDKHIDFEYSHKGAVFSLNTCDGFTRLEDGTKIKSVENRILFFDPSKLHNSSTTSNAKGRFNINFNWL